MLNSEHAAALLEKQANANWIDARLKAARILPATARKVAYALLDRDENGKEPPMHGAYWKQRAFHDEAQPLLDTLSENDLRALLEVLFGRLASHVHAGYRFLYSLPYPTNYDRKAFRAPRLPRATQHARFYWLYLLLKSTGPYDQNIAWFAAWATYLGWHQDALGRLFAAAIDSGGKEGEEVFDILIASARGEHEIGAMGRHVTRALLAASRPDGWEFIEQMLLAAQRQEGLRQVILETVDEAHPQAFRKMLRLILEHDLVRFSATVRAADVWLGLSWDAASTRVVHDTLQRLLCLLEDPDAPSRVLADPTSTPETLYLALWSMAFQDAEVAISPATGLLAASDSERRFIAAHLLSQLRLAPAYAALVPVLDDPDLGVALRAFNALAAPAVRLDEIAGGSTRIFEALERLVQRLPVKRTELKAVVWPWMTLTADRQQVTGAMLHHLGSRPPTRLVPYLPMMETWDRGRVVDMLMEQGKGDVAARDTIFSLVGDPSSTVREKALDAVSRFKITGEDAAKFEWLLTRKAGDLRRGVISLLLGQSDQASLASARRLTSSTNGLQRLAGLELLRQMVSAQRSPSECRAIAQEYRQSRATLETDEEKLLDSLTGGEGAHQPITLENGLGLFDPGQRTPGLPPRQDTERKVGLLDRLFNGKNKGAHKDTRELLTEAAAAIIRALDDLVHTHREMPVPVERWTGSQAEELLGNLTWGFPAPQKDIALEEDLARLPLREELEKWWRDRPHTLRDPDGLEVLQALAPFQTGHWGIFGYGDIRRTDPPWLRHALKVLYADFDTQKLRYCRTVETLLLWLLKMHPPQGAVDLLLEAVETTFSLVPRSEWQKDEEDTGFNPYEQGWRNNNRLMGWLSLAHVHRNYFPEQWANEQHVRLWRLLRWLDQPAEGMERMRPELDLTLAAYVAGGATEADVLDHLIGPRIWKSWGHSFTELHALSGRKPTPEMSKYPFLAELVERCRRRIIEIELARGDMATPASNAALSLRWTGGLETLVKVLAGMGKENFVRGWNSDAVSKAAVFSHIVRSTFPGEGDTYSSFADQMRAARVSQKRLLELAMYAPQWAGHVEHTLGWPQLAEAVWWLHAHTKDTAWTVDKEVRDSWTAQVSERTPLSGQSLLDGAVDVAWFGRVYSALGAERWEKLYAVAQYASGGGGHKRAQLFADAMLERLAKEELVGRISSKRHQDAIRALGLLPLPEGDGEADILERYKVIQEFLRTSKQFGSQRQASEKLAAGIGMENLARTAGYPDPIRLEWAMEAKAVEDLASGSLTATVDNVTLELTINDWGEAELMVAKNGKPLKNIPPKIKKDPGVIAIREREREVGKQVSRMRLSLENAMCRGDQFTGKELRDFFSHPALRPMVERLVFMEDGSTGKGSVGYPVEGGHALLWHDGQAGRVHRDAILRIAHPHDLLTMDEWHLWQHELFVAERVQPFKQVFRELYVLTPAERVEGDFSRRYEGHQVNPRQALALLGSRGWVNHPEEGVRRTFHDTGISAWITFFEGFYTPADVEGLTLEHAHFTRRGDWKRIPLEEVPPRIFSEVMRDLDLVVSVAHRGGVDPESSASTVGIRAALINETSAMLDIDNVRVKGLHALVEGKLGSYSVHLGSGVVHRQLGGALCIIPVHSQHRGRLFLPFADDDPKTAEVLSKVLLLARDTDIKDPTILEQILNNGR